MRATTRPLSSPAIEAFEVEHLHLDGNHLSQLQLLSNDRQLRGL